ncbi:MAG: cytochrome c maturation protein CcmE [Cyclobacteriaceae bacterium]|nr:cytochrome c maturation protein CcmE [Cyclobacteriaceae bacterium]
MKKSHLFGIIIIGIAVTIIISTAGDASTYVDFDTAYEMAKGGNAEKIHVIGTLKRDRNGDITGIVPSENKLTVKFQLIDENMNEHTIFYNEPMPADLASSEQVVVVGAFKEDVFIADKVLLKCPSKYNNETMTVEQDEQATLK